ncbi:TIGR03084 family metal-binding protein [Nocardioides zeae]|uniref:TIGR03084 family protein n=1 Tax=Nocardioides zeae TaxID=1457234 RepID=A0A6P0HNU1_9ACTN|nr:TIGR03084 family metal-binding protein [Nocardioides zeae]NEN79914.1 TIGR03084 family protein [Nocardioides zeae]
MTDPNPVLEGVLTDLAALTGRLDDRVADLPDDPTGWRRATPAAGWDVAAQVAHLAWTDVAAATAARAVRGEQEKAAWDAIVMVAIDDPAGFVDAAAAEGSAVPAADLLAHWRTSRADLAAALRALAAERPGERLPWFGPPMSPVSMATARYMETWAHGLDVTDALGLDAQDDDGLRHVCHIGARTRGFSFATRGLEAPTAPVRVRLTLPSGATWSDGPEDADERVEGPAVDFARLVTQRAHRDDLAVTATGAGADRWLDIAQAFAGPPGQGRAPAATTTITTTEGAHP